MSVNGDKENKIDDFIQKVQELKLKDDSNSKAGNEFHTPIFKGHNFLRNTRKKIGDEDDGESSDGRPEAFNWRMFGNISKYIPSFDPTKNDLSMEDWIARIDEYAEMYGMDDLATRHYALNNLQGVARDWRMSIDGSQMSWDDWKELLLENFPSEGSTMVKRRQAEKYKREDKQDLLSYYFKKLALCNKANMETDEICEQIVKGMCDDRIREFLGPLRRYDKPSELLIDLKEADRVYANKPNYFQKKRKPDFVKDDRKLSRETKSANTSTNTSGDKSKIICFTCHTEGHFSKACPKKKSRNEDVVNKIDEMKSYNNVSTHSKFVKPATLDGKAINCYIDLGSGATLIRKEDALSRGFETFSECKLPAVKGYGGGKVEILGKINGNLSISGVSAVVEIFVVPDECQNIPLLVGHQYTEKSHIRIVSDVDGLHISEIRKEPPLNFDVADGVRKVNLIAKENVVVPSMFVGNIQVQSNITEAELFIDGDRSQVSRVVPACIITVNDGVSTVPVANFSKDEIQIQANSTVIRAEICQPINLINEDDLHDSKMNQQETEILGIDVIDTNCKSKTTIPFRNDKVELIENICTDLIGNNLINLKKLLYEFQDVVACKLSDLGVVRSHEMAINTKDDIPVYFRPYRLSISEREWVKGHVSDLKHADIVEDAKFDYASPIILVRKKSGEFRMCVDYRALNAKTVKEHYPLPLIDDQLDRLGGNKFFTNLDLFSGYYQVPIEEKSRHKTAFITPDGTFQFKRMPFGLCNSPAIFQRVINAMLGMNRYTIAMAYLDDLIIPSVSIEEGLQRLRLILKVIQDAGLTINLNKCKFLCSKVDYLGFTISADGIEPGSSKIIAVSNFPEPRTIRDIRSFCGLASYFRRFIKNYALLSKPLTDLLKKDCNFEWGPNQNDAFIKIKEYLTSKPILAIYNPSARLEVHTDASGLGLGAVLYQECENNLWKPICYYSRKTTSEESKYPAVELEILAIVCALEKFRVYLLGKMFVIRTDCNSIKLLSKKKDLNSRLGRWFLRLAEFEFVVEYVKGSSNLVADALSRFPVGEKEVVDIGDASVVLQIDFNTDWVAALQRTDADIVKIREGLELGDEKVSSKFTLYNSRVYKCTGDRWRLYVPDDMIFDVVRDAHESVVHQGVEKTVEKLKTTFYFPKMKEIVWKYVNRCVKCMYYKEFSGKREGLLHPLEKGLTPFATVHYDHIGPYLTTKRKNKYVGAIIDGFSKYVVLGAMPDVSAKHTVDLFINFMANYGKPERVISDRGTAFTSNEFRDLCEEFGIQHVKIASGCPRSNGQVEKVNRTINTSLAILTDVVDNNKWDLKLPEIQLGINTTVHKVTKKIPADIIFRNKIRSLKDSALVLEIENINKVMFSDSDEDVNKTVSELLEKNRDIMRKHYDPKRKKAFEYKEKDLVLLRCNPPSTGESRKLEPLFRGPYEVTAVLGNDRYHIRDIEGEQQSGRVYESDVAADRLRLVKRLEVFN